MRKYRAKLKIERPDKYAQYYLHSARGKRARDRHLLTKYGLTPEDYELMLKQQEGCCAICKAVKAGRGSNHFHVDHNHVTGKVRGLLCNSCNRGIGYLRDSLEILERASDYIRQYS